MSTRGRPRRLSDDQMIAARWEYENTPISGRALARKYGLGSTAMKEWVSKEQWKKLDELRAYEGEEGERQFQRDLRAAVNAAHDRKIIKGLEQALNQANDNKPTDKPTGASEKPTRPPVGRKSTKGRVAPPADQPQRPEDTLQALGAVVRFPGAYVPPPTPPRVSSASFPTRSRTEQVAQRVKLAALRGELALQQIEQLGIHEELIWDYHHIAAVYLNPSKYVDVEGLSAEDAKQKLEDVGRAAARMLLPTERDTLAGTLLALNKMTIASFEAKRRAAGITPRGLAGRRANDNDAVDDDGPQIDLTAADTQALRNTRSVMELIRGRTADLRDAPKPPPPDRLDDIMVLPGSDLGSDRSDGPVDHNPEVV